MDIQQTDNEKLILEAAIKEFSLKGFDGARTARIAAEAGVTHAMLHYYYRTKENLFHHIFQEKMKDLGNLLIGQIVESTGEIRERVRKLVADHFDFLKSNSTLPMFLITTLNSRPELFEKLAESLDFIGHERLAALQAEFDEAAGKGEIKPVEVVKLLGDIASLNVFPFIATPLLMTMAGYGPEQREEFLEMRKQESIETILKRIS